MYVPSLCRFAEELLHDGVGNGCNAVRKEDDHGWTLVVPPPCYGRIRSLESCVEIVASFGGVWEKQIEELIRRSRGVVFAHGLRTLSV